MTTCPACGANDQNNPATFDIRGAWTPATGGAYAIVGADTKAPIQRVLRLHCNVCDWLSEPGRFDGAAFMPQAAPGMDSPLTTSGEVPAGDPSA